MENENPRFTTISGNHDNHFSGTHYVVKDNVTGVLYYIVNTMGQGSGVGVTPLLDPGGKPIVEPVDK